MKHNLIIFSAWVCLAGWLGLALEQLQGGEQQSGFGLLLWLVSPLVGCLLLRAFGGDGWSDLGLRPGLGRNLSWYLMSALVYPGVAVLVLIVGLALGAVKVPGLPGNTPQAFFMGVAFSLAPLFFKNIFEEFGWRGYLTPRMAAARVNDTLADVLTGLVWATWHLPYYFGLLSREEFTRYTSQGLGVFMITMYIGLVASSLVYGVIRRQSGTLWPAVLMHAVGNAFLVVLLGQDFVVIRPQVEFLFTPSLEGLLSAGLLALIGIGLQRMMKAPRRLKRI